MMTPEKKIEKITQILDFDNEADAYYNLLAAATDLKKERADEVCINTIDRVLSQLAAVSMVIHEKNR